MRLILMYKLNGNKEIKVINSWAVTILIYGTGVLKWRVSKHKLLTIHKWLHPKNDVDRLYIGRKEGGSGMMSYESTVRFEVP